MRLAHGAQRGEQQESAALARGNHRQRGFDHGLSVAGGIRLRHVERRIEHGLTVIVERAFPARTGRVEQAKLLAIMRKITFDRECGRGEDPGSRAAFDLFLEYVGDRQRRGVEGQRLAEGLDPAHAFSG